MGEEEDEDNAHKAEMLPQDDADAAEVSKDADSSSESSQEPSEKAEDDAVKVEMLSQDSSEAAEESEGAADKSSGSSEHSSEEDGNQRSIASSMVV